MSNVTTENPWIRVKDFEESTYWILGKNAVTDTPLTPDKKVELSEVSERHLTLQMPQNSCALGHLLILTIRKTARQVSTKNGKPVFSDHEPPPITLTAKVTEIDPLTPGAQSVTLKLYQFNEDEWRDFLLEIQKCQTRVRERIMQMKGE